MKHTGGMYKVKTLCIPGRQQAHDVVSVGYEAGTAGVRTGLPALRRFSAVWASLAAFVSFA
jgi:hypothetical protein